ncbi:MAG: hypothetical protein IPJ75_18525 [Ignavibacteriales bacterium]|nr:hypothetical protein [Ignavibacteriales bacterium]
MKQFCNIFLSVFFCLFTISSYAQEFIPSLGLTTGDWGYNEIGNMNREKLMPYHTSAIKKNGISKEFHVIDQDTVAIFTYSSKGLLITSVLKPGEIFAKEVFEFSYNEDDELIEISCISHTSKNCRDILATLLDKLILYGPNLPHQTKSTLILFMTRGS